MPVDWGGSIQGSSAFRSDAPVIGVQFIGSGVRSAGGSP